MRESRLRSPDSVFTSVYNCLQPFTMCSTSMVVLRCHVEAKERSQHPATLQRMAGCTALGGWCCAPLTLGLSRSCLSTGVLAFFFGPEMTSQYEHACRVRCKRLEKVVMASRQL